MAEQLLTVCVNIPFDCRLRISRYIYAEFNIGVSLICCEVLKTSFELWCTTHIEVTCVFQPAMVIANLYISKSRIRAHTENCQASSILQTHLLIILSYFTMSICQVLSLTWWDGMNKEWEWILKNNLDLWWELASYCLHHCKIWNFCEILSLSLSLSGNMI
jgi:hypothetical protein